jgi:hypothetical protein
LNQQQQEKPSFQLAIAVPKQKSAAENRTEKKPERVREIYFKRLLI